MFINLCGQKIILIEIHEIQSGVERQEIALYCAHESALPMTIYDTSNLSHIIV